MVTSAGLQHSHPLPNLPSLKLKPSWVNRAGRIDRSACIELRASEIWPRVALHAWEDVDGKSASAANRGRLKSARHVITARELFELHESRPARKLVGDWRTPKSNAMKRPHDPPPHKRRQKLKDTDQRYHAIVDPTNPQYENPNAGAGRSKKLGLWSGREPAYRAWGPWSQELTIEKWDRAAGAAGAASKDKAYSIKHKEPRPAWGGGDESPTPVSRGIVPTHQHFLICPKCKQKMVKLFMVLATAQEVDDAEIAEGWVKLLDAWRAASRIPLNFELAKQRAMLIDRYGLLFRGPHAHNVHGGTARRLVCRNCLNIRYGEVKKYRRENQQHAATWQQWEEDCQKSAISRGGQRSEIGSQRSEVGSQRSDVRRELPGDGESSEFRRQWNAMAASINEVRHDPDRWGPNFRGELERRVNDAIMRIQAMFAQPLEDY